MTCFDTAVLIWGVQGTARPNQRGMIGRTRKFLRFLQTKREKVIIPAPVIGEYLSGFPIGQQRRQRATLESHFRIPAFDMEAAALMAELGYDPEALKKIRKESKADRQSLKFDLQIIAIAILNGADRIVTDDVAAFTKMAQDRIKIVEVPDIPNQTQFDFPEDSTG